MSNSLENNNKNIENTADDENASVASEKLTQNSVNYAVLQEQMLLAQMQQKQSQDSDVNLAELWRAIWAGKLTVIIICFMFAIGSILFALSQPNVYKASAILAPASNEGGAGGLAALAGQFGGLASMAGINLGGGQSDKTALALEIIKSRSFIQRFIAKHDLMIPIMAAESWDIATDTLIINKEIFDQTTNQWLRKVKAPKKPEPSLWEAYSEFSDLLIVSQDKNTGMITLELEYFSPAMAQQWLSWLISDVNEFIRNQDQKEAQDSIDYLTKQLESIHVSSMETVFYQLIEEQTKNMMLTKVKAEYVLKTIDPAQVPEEKSKPKRALIVVLGTILGLIISIIIVFIRYFAKK